MQWNKINKSPCNIECIFCPGTHIHTTTTVMKNAKLLPTIILACSFEIEALHLKKKKSCGGDHLDTSCPICMYGLSGMTVAVN